MPRAWFLCGQHGFSNDVLFRFSGPVRTGRAQRPVDGRDRCPPYVGAPAITGYRSQRLPVRPRIATSGSGSSAGTRQARVYPVELVCPGSCGQDWHHRRRARSVGGADMDADPCPVALLATMGFDGQQRRAVWSDGHAGLVVDPLPTSWRTQAEDEQRLRWSIWARAGGAGCPGVTGDDAVRHRAGGPISPVGGPSAPSGPGSRRPTSAAAATGRQPEDKHGRVDHRRARSAGLCGDRRFAALSRGQSGHA